MNDDSAATPETNTAPNALKQWPGAFGVYKFSKQVVAQNLGTLVILWLLSAIIGGGFEWQLKEPGKLFSFIIGSLATASYILTFLASLRGEKISVGEAIQNALPFWLKVIGLNLLVVVSLMVSFLLLIVPFFFVFPRLVLANYFLIDKKLGIVDAYKASWYATKSHASKVWGVVGVNILMAALMITIIGIPVAIYLLVMYSASFAILYKHLPKQG